MQKLLSWKLFFLILTFILFLFPLFTPGIYQTHDAEANVARFASYFKAFSDGQFPPRWAGDLNYRYGSPVLIFYYPLTGYASSLMHLLGFGFESTYKIFLTVSFLSSFFSFYLWSKNKFSKNISFFASLLYFLSPYHLLNLYVRGDVAELVALAIAPLVLLYIEKISKAGKAKDILIGSIIYAFLIMGHNGIALIFTPVFLIYSFISQNKKTLPLSLVMIIGGLGLSSFFWIPAIFEGKYVNAKLFVGNMYKDNFLNALKIVYSSWGFGADVNKAGGLSPQVGAPYILFVISGILFFQKIKNKFFYFWILVFIGSIFMTFPYSNFIWEKISLLKLLEFPWRFISLASFSVAALIPYIFEKIKKEAVIIAFSICTLCYCAFFIKVDRPNSSKPDSFYINYPYTTYFHGEASPIWTAGDASSYPKNSYEVVGNGQISNFKRKTNEHIFIANSNSAFEFIDNTVYFPGWRVEIDGRKQEIEFQNSKHRGLISFTIPSGEHLVVVRFAESAIRLYADLISLGFLILVGIVFIFKKEK